MARCRLSSVIGTRLPSGLPDRRGPRDEDVRGALDVAAHDRAAVVRGHLVERRHELVVGVERDLGDPGQRPAGLLDVQPALRAQHDERTLGGVADQALPVEHGVGAQHHRQQVRVEVVALAADMADLALRAVPLAGDRVAVLAGDDQLPRGHLVEGQGAGLVRADRGRRAQRLHGGQSFDDGVAAGDLAGAHREQRGHHGRQAGRDRGHREGDAGDEQRVERLAPRQAQQHDQRRARRRRWTR